MRIDDDEVRRVAALAKLRLSDGEISSMVEHFRRLGGYFEALMMVDVDLPAVDIEEPGRMREDQVRRWKDRDLVLMGAPRREGHFFKVPRIGFKE